MQTDLIWSWTAVGFVLMVPTIVVAQRIDRRHLSGANVWAKPFKFALSLSIHYATFAVIAHYLPTGDRQGSGNVFLAVVSSAAGIGELAYIALQAARARHSHFNVSTPIEAAASILMGVGALIVIAPAGVIGCELMLSPPATWPMAVTTGTAAGLLGGAVLTVVTAGRMGSVRSHFVANPPGQDRTMPVTGWSLDGADLRPAHFLATHMMQAVPIASLIAVQLLPASIAVAMSVLAATAWTALTLALFSWTKKGMPLSAISWSARSSRRAR
jgi:hypothetical protein